MGYRVQEDIKARCPLYEQVVRTKNGNIAGVQCEPIMATKNLGFTVSTVIRCRNYREARDYKAIFCDDLYETCPYYRAWCLANEGAKGHR